MKKDTIFYAFWNGKRHEIKASSLWDAKQKAIQQLKIPKSKVGRLGIMSKDAYDNQEFRFEIAEVRGEEIWVVDDGTSVFPIPPDDYNENEHEIIAKVNSWDEVDDVIDDAMRGRYDENRKIMRRNVNETLADGWDKLMEIAEILGYEETLGELIRYMDNDTALDAAEYIARNHEIKLSGDDEYEDEDYDMEENKIMENKNMKREEKYAASLKNVLTENLRRLENVQHRQFDVLKEEYNGWRNYETWNTALWIGNDEGLYRAAVEFMDDNRSNNPYRDFIQFIGLDGERTPDGVEWLSNKLDYGELDEMMRELS